MLYLKIYLLFMINDSLYLLYVCIIVATVGLSVERESVSNT